MPLGLMRRRGPRPPAYGGGMRSLAVSLTLAATVALAACAGGAGTEEPGAPAATDAVGTAPAESGQTASGEPGSVGSDATGQPALDVEVVASGLELPWDVQLLPNGTALVSERGGRLLTLAPGEEPATVEVDLPGFFTGSESGLMGLAVSPDFAEDRTVLACHATQAGGTPQDVRVVRLTLAEDLAAASVDGVVVDGIPITSGRHSGCRLLLDGETLYVGTGDAADETTPQSLTSLGGKVLAMTVEGEPLPGTPVVEGADPLVLTYGHRNVQGLALQPGTGEIWSVEHGPDVDDEVNILQARGNYGWAPGPGYDEGVPMTDHDRFPDAVDAVWSSGDPTHATSGAVFLQGEQWGAWEGALAVAELKGSGVTVLAVDGTTVGEVVRVPELDGTHGRLRSLTLDPEGALWVTTSNGQDDEVLRVTPRS